MPGKSRTVALLVVAEILAMSLWFVSSSIQGELSIALDATPWQQAALAAAVQAGFVLGAVAMAVLGLADSLDPRRVLACSALIAAVCNAALLLPVSAEVAIGLRALTGVCLAGVYPVGMKIVVGWGLKDRGLLVGLLVAGLTLGSSAPHLLAYLGASHWQLTVALASGGAVLAGVLALCAELGPHHAQGARFDVRAVKLAWQDRRIRAAYLGYLGHMWELYAMWAWIGTAVAGSYVLTMSPEAASSLSKLTVFVAIGSGAVGCVLAGAVADRIGKAELTIVAMGASAIAALLTAAFLYNSPIVVAGLVVLWGIAIIPDSAQFSALVADYAPPEQVGSLLTLQTALGFALTIATVQGAPLAAAVWGWQWVLASLALGPVLGIVAMLPLCRGAAEPTRPTVESL